MKHNKRKRKSTPVAADVAEPAEAHASAIAHDARDLCDDAPAVKSAPTNSSADYSLEPVCTIREGAALKSALLGLEHVESTVVLDVHAVERIDTAALQLLCAFVRDRRAKGRRTQWLGQPTAFAEAVELLGLTQALGYAPEKAA